MNVFIDTWGWVAIADENDSYHNEATTTYNECVLKAGNSLYTSDFVLLETLTFLRQKIGHTRAVRWMKTLLEEESLGALTTIHANHTIWQNAFQLLQQYEDKPGISFVDFTSFVIMQERSIIDVFTGDRHFEQVNLGFRILR